MRLSFVTLEHQGGLSNIISHVRALAAPRFDKTNLWVALPISSRWKQAAASHRLPAPVWQNSELSGTGINFGLPREHLPLEGMRAICFWMCFAKVIDAGSARVAHRHHEHSHIQSYFFIYL